MMEKYRGEDFSWNKLISSLPKPHLLQTWEWAQVKVKYGWQAMPFIWLTAVSSQPSAAAMILKRVIPGSGFARKMCILYIPKGPLLNWEDEQLRSSVLDDLHAFAKNQGAIFIKIDPEVVLGTGIPGEKETAVKHLGQAVMTDLQRRGWLFSSDQVQFRNTVLVDLTPSEDELLRRMKQKTRYNIRLAEKKGVSVRIGSSTDLPMLYRMYAETSVRDGFVIRDESYYQTVWQTFMDSQVGRSERPQVSTFQLSGLPTCEPLIAEVEGQAVAAINIFYFAGRAYYLYGMSREAHREKMPNHLLQWEAMRRAKSVGCTIYDLWGAPDVFDESDGMWGVFRFKEGLGGQVLRTLGAWDFPPSGMWYRMYTQIIPKVLDVMRSRGRARTRQGVN